MNASVNADYMLDSLAIIENYVARISAFWVLPCISLPKIKYSRIKKLIESSFHKRLQTA